MSLGTAYLIGSIFAIIATILLCILVVPENKKATFANNKFLLFLHDLFNFKHLFLEMILKVLYILSTTVCIFAGFFMLFAQQYTWGYASRSMAPTGLVVMILGPILVRIIYESSMYMILLVKNTMQINKKMGDTADDKSPEVKPENTENN